MNPLGQKIIVAAFDGWNDASEAASAALTTVMGSDAYDVLFSLDPELYFDYQYTRPQLTRAPDGTRGISWPQTRVLRKSEPSGEESEIILLTGSEPARAWQSFCAEILDVALREDVTGFVTLGALMGDVPHTRPISVFGTSENADVQATFDVDQSTYEGPVGIVTVLTEALENAGIPTLNLWARVPHYVSGHTPSPKASLALIMRLEEVTGLTLPHGALPAAAATWEATIDAAASDDEEMTEYIRQLEQARDAWDSPGASGDAIAKEFEQYLRRGGDQNGRRPDRGV